MAVNMYLIHPKRPDDERANEVLADLVVSFQGFILMATSHGSLIAAFDEAYLGAVQGHPETEFVGGVTLDPDKPLARHLQRLFAENIAAQLVSRGLTQPQQTSLPPGYRPMRWSRSYEKGGD